MKKTFFLLFMSLVAIVAQAKTEINGIAYNLNGSTLTAEVTSKRVVGYSGSVDIPSSVDYSGNTYTVTSIGNGAFSGCTGLTSVTIPGSVTSIGNGAFSVCIGLTSINIPNSVTTIGDNAFSDCTGLTSVSIPNSVTSIGKNPFSCCRSLTAITVDKGNQKYDSRDNCNAIIETEYNALIAGCKNTQIPDGIIFIEDEAFDGCSGLTSINIPNGVTSIGDRAFALCSGLTSIEIPGSVTSIGNEAFYICGGLTSVTIPNSVTSIGDMAFGHCSGLTSINIPNSVTSIGKNPFSGCGSLTAITVDKGNQKYDSRDNCNAIIETEYNALIAGCKNTQIPDGIIFIEDAAFEGCSGLTSIEIPGSVTSIGDRAFSGCSGLTSIEIPGSVTSIGNYAFRNCSSLTSVTIPSSVTSIGDDAFIFCNNLKTVKVIVTDYSSFCTNIVTRAFTRWSLTIHLLDNSGNEIRDFVIPNGVTSIGDAAFEGCSGLTSIEIPGSVTSIGNVAFYGCSGLTSVIIPGSVTSIGIRAFDECNSIIKVYSLSEKPCSIEKSFTEDVYKRAILFVPNGCKAIYQSTAAWNLFANIVEFDPETVGVDAVKGNDEAAESAFYTFDGKQLQQKRRGLQIVRMSDGTVRKVFVK